MPRILTLPEIREPPEIPTPNAGYLSVYAEDDHKIHTRDSTGTESILSTQTFTETLALGNTQIYAITDSNNAGLLLAMSVYLPVAATIQSILFFVTGATGRLVLGIYDSAGAGTPAAPKNLMATSAIFTPTTGWNTANMLVPTLLPAGLYYLTHFPESNSLQYRNDQIGGGSNRSSFKETAGARSFGYLPPVFPAATEIAVGWSKFAVLTR